MLVRRFLENEKATLDVAGLLAKSLDGHGVVYLHGHLGAGKTTFSRGVLHEYGHSGAVKSPTYTLVEPYELGSFHIFHFDLYRLSDPEELEYMGIRDYFDQQALCLVEWPEQGEGILPEPDLAVRLNANENGRFLEIESCSEFGVSALAKFEQLLRPNHEG